MPLTIEPVDYKDEPTTLHGLLMWDDTPRDRRPGILVVHGGAGLDEHAKGRARRFAESGFVALACDMYGEGVVGNRERIIRCILDFQAEPLRFCRRAQPALDLLRSHPQVDGRLGAVGYCFGGMAVLELARGGLELKGVVSVHGSLATSQPAKPGAINAKILVCHGALDPHVPTAQVTGFADEMNGVGADYQLIVYGGAMHGFTHETATGQQPGVAYHATSDARSSRAILCFFDEIFTT